MSAPLLVEQLMTDMSRNIKDVRGALCAADRPAKGLAEGAKVDVA